MNNSSCGKRNDSLIDKKVHYKTLEKPCISYSCYKRNSNPFNTKEVIVDNNYTSINNKLVGGPNPKTLIPPVITTPCYSLAWKDSDLVVPSHINDHTTEYLYLSGYLSKDDKETPDPTLDSDLYEYKNSFRSAPEAVKDPLNSTSMTPERLLNVRENFEQAIPTYEDDSWRSKINVSHGYNSNQFENSRFPNNLPRGRAEQSSDLGEYNENLFTQTVQPGVYYRNDVIESANSNIGISFQQDFLPRKASHMPNGDVLVEDMDPNITEQTIPTYDAAEQSPTMDNVYDPRFNGYGSASRCYIHNVTGQPRFPYDDINAVRMPNYVVRSKIDTQDFADRYDTMQDTGKSLNEIRPLANSAFIKDSETHRNGIMVDAMRKINAVMWQRRAAPLLGVARR
jgi:hypothetical protein